MFFRNTLLIFFFILTTNCTTETKVQNKLKIIDSNNFRNKGFTLVYNETLYEKGVISKKLDPRSLMIFQKNLKIDTYVKITNIFNNKSLIVRVGKKSDYPFFNNSVTSSRIAEELDLDINEPYVEILEIAKDSIFIAKKAKTFDEEKNVAIKAPVNKISINDLNEIKTKNKKTTSKKFSYKIIIANFYFEDTAKIMVQRIINETSIKNPKIKKISGEKYRVYLGPFSNIKSLQNSYNDVNILGFENIEIIRND